MEDYKSLVEVGADNDIGKAIQDLITHNLKLIHTSFLCKIVSINGNKVSIMPILKKSSSENLTIINNCLVAFAYSQNWQTQFKLRVGDIGIALVIENDLSSYKKTGKEGLNNTRRFKDINDSIFIPLSLFKTLNNDDINFIIESHTKKCKLEFDNNEIGILKAKLLTIESENTTLKKELGKLVSLLEAMASGQTGADGHGHTSQTSPGSVGVFNNWFSQLSNLFKE